jgi:F-type H+-transporting ATPase subunit b
MLIDWFTVAAQAINFVILVWLLKRYLYGPVLAVIDSREKKVTAELAEAEKREAQARSQSEDLLRRTAAFDRDREQLLQKAASDADAERERLLTLSRDESAAVHSKLQAALAAERASVGRELKRRAQGELFAMAGKILADLADTSLEAQMVGVFIRKLREQPLIGLDRSAGTAVVRTAFATSEASRAELEQAVKDALGEGIHLHFEVVPEIVSGIELRVEDHKVAWSICDYLETLSRQTESADVC